LLIEDALPALDQGFVIDPVHAGKKVLPQPLQKRGQGFGGEGLILSVEEVVLAFLAPIKT